MSEKCRNNNRHNNSDNYLTSRRTDGGKNAGNIFIWLVLATTKKFLLTRRYDADGFIFPRFKSNACFKL